MPCLSARLPACLPARRESDRLGNQAGENGWMLPGRSSPAFSAYYHRHQAQSQAYSRTSSRQSEQRATSNEQRPDTLQTSTRGTAPTSEARSTQSMKRTVISGSLLKLFSPSSRIQNRTIPLVSTKMSSNTAAPLFSFNPNLHLRTIDPPVQIGAKWAQSYPSSNSPFSPADASDKYPLLNLAQGVPGHPPTRALLEQVAHQTLAENSPKPAGHSHGYGPVFGDDKIREAVAREVNHFYRSKDESAQKGARNQVNADNVAITAGCNLAFSATAMSLAAPGEAIVVPTPWYFNHFMTLASLGIETIPLSTDGPSFLPSPAVIRNLFEESQQGKTPKIKAIILVTPNNPTSAIYPPALIHQVGRLCHEFKVALLMDET